MYEKVEEPVEVLVAFNKNKIFPLFFKWNKRRYKVDKVNLVHSAKKGDNKLFYYSVTNKSNYFQLSFNPKNMRWYLEELYTY